MYEVRIYQLLFYHFFPPAQLVRGLFTLSDLLDKMMVTGVPTPPRYVSSLLSRIEGFSTPTARRFALNSANSRTRAIRESILSKKKSPRPRVRRNSGRLEAATLTYYLIGTRYTYSIRNDDIPSTWYNSCKVPVRIACCFIAVEVE